VTEQRPWPPEQSAKGTLRPWHYTAAGYLAVLFEDPEEAQRAQRSLRERGVPEGDLRLYDGEETLRIASRLQQERSILAKAITPRQAVPSSLSMPPPSSAPTGW